MRRGEIWWADLPESQRSEPGFKRPVIIMQSDRLNETGITTTVVAILTSNLRLGDMPRNVFVERSLSLLPQDSVVNVSQITAVDKLALVERVGRFPDDVIREIESGIRLVLAL